MWRSAFMPAILLMFLNPSHAADAVTPAFIEVAGVQWVEGEWKKGPGFTSNQVYTGDTVYLKLRFTDEKGRVVEAVGGVAITLKKPGKRTVHLKRTIRTRHWKSDARKLNKRNAGPKAIAYDPDSEEMLLGIVVVPYGTQFDYTMDITFQDKNRHVWQWKDLSKPWETGRTPYHE